MMLISGEDSAKELKLEDFMTEEPPNMMALMEPVRFLRRHY